MDRACTLPEHLQVHSIGSGKTGTCLFLQRFPEAILIREHPETGPWKGIVNCADL